MTGSLSSVFPRPRSGDSDDVVWTLQTAAVQWQRGLRADAIVWVRRAADTSVQIGHLERAEELRDYAARLAEYLWTDPQNSVPAPGLSNPAMPVHPQALEQVAHLGELDREEVPLDSYDLQIASAPMESRSAEVMELTDADLDEEVLDEELLEDELEFIDGDLMSPSTQVEPTSSRGYDSSRDSFMSISPEEDDEDELIFDARDSLETIDASSHEEPSERPTLPHVEDIVAAESSTRLSSTGAEPREAMNTLAMGGDVVCPDSRLASSRVSSVPPTLRRGRLDGVNFEEAAPATEFPEDGPELEISASDAASLRAEILSSPPGDALDNALADALLEDLADVEIAAPITPDASPVPPPPVSSPARPQGPPEINGLRLEDAEVLADLPEEAQQLLVSAAEMHSIDGHESLLLEEGVALVTEGSIHVMLDGSEISAARLGVGGIVAIDGSLGRQPLELVADASTPRIAVWPQETLDSATADCPWVVDDLRVLADRFQAQAGAGQGEMGARLDDGLRTAVYERLSVKVLQPGERIATKGEPLGGLFVVAGGQLHVGLANGPDQLVAGQFVFPSCVIGAVPAPDDVTAGAAGALTLYATRAEAHDLMMSVPPLLEILAG